ncbi:unnamed protein product [Musa hybrid cultivar]
MNHGEGMGHGSCNKKHIILVHGACHGAWSWHKVTTQLRSAGYQVTVPDLAASGVDERRFQDLRTFTDYSLPLLDILACLPPGERVILVGHSLGGLNIALAMDRFPEKIAAAVFVTALMPDSVNPPSYVVDKLKKEKTMLFWSDTQFGLVGDEDKGPVSLLFGPKFLSKLYARSPPEDLTLARTLMRPSSLFLEDLGSIPPFSESGYGSVEKIYVVCAQDEILTEGFQRWMIENNPVKEVRELEDADHMPMFSTPKQLFQCLSDRLRNQSSSIAPLGCTHWLPWLLIFSGVTFVRHCGVHVSAHCLLFLRHNLSYSFSGEGMGDGSCNKKHIILVHGACHGAWSWHKVTTQLRSAGYQVTVPDLAASGVDERRFQDLRSFIHYSQPLLDILACLPPGERVILVGHSLGGLNIALAMDRFPEKIAAAVFVTALMPDSVNPPSYVMDKLNKENTMLFWSDTQFGSVGDEDKGPVSFLLGPKFLSKLYTRSPPEDLTLARTLMRPSSFFLEDLGSMPPFSESGYGSVEKVYVVCAQDEIASEGFQRWMIENNPVKEVRELEDADHMPMFSTPKQLFQCLSDVADAYA